MSTALAYHAATKYAPETIGNLPGLDPEAQPVPYKSYETEAPIELAEYLPLSPNPFTGEDASAAATEASPRAQLARLLYAAYGITGVVPQQPLPLYLRAAPSAGGLYPAELYVVAHGVVTEGDEGIADGLYGFDPLRHRLVPLWSGTEAHAALQAACYASAAIAAARLSVLVTGVFERSRWRYRERAYRRILLDSGHLVGNAGLAAPACGWRVHATSAFCDAGVERLLRLDPAEEGALAVLALVPLAAEVPRPAWTVLRSPIGSAEATSPLLDALHHAAALPAQRPPAVTAGERLSDDLAARHGWAEACVLDAEAETIDAEEAAAEAAADAAAHRAEARDDAPAEAEARHARARPRARAVGELSDPFAAIVRRRSTRRFRSQAIGQDDLAAILRAGLQPDAAGLPAQPGFEPARLLTFVGVAAVSGLDPGVYYLPAAPLRSGLPGTSPVRPPVVLRPVRKAARSADARAAARFLCLGQDLGGDAAAVIVHAGDLAAGVRDAGDRVYRTLHLDAGLIGQRLNLAALARGLGASGIGGFFDDACADVLGIPHDYAVVYLTVIGVPG